MALSYTGVILRHDTGNVIYTDLMPAAAAFKSELVVMVSNKHPSVVCFEVEKKKKSGQ